MVYIKKITMRGFKSYGSRKVSVSFSKGFTCIVGPNGSGKSNVVDAISFVLGRLSTKSMRADVLTDLIFGGYKSKLGAKLAEVSIYFDNKDGTFPSERKEVVISRTVDLSGKSVYRLNRKRETRGYILDMLSQIGIFPEGHNLVMQGDVARFIKMNRWERRGVIEEISGILEYNEKRERGERELKKAEDNIQRVELVLQEVERRLERLEEEKKDALRYQELKREIQRYEGLLVHSELKRALKYQKQISEEIEEKEENKKEFERRIGETQKEMMERKRLFDQLEREISRLEERGRFEVTRKLEELKARRHSLKSEIDLKESQMKGLEERVSLMEREALESKRVIEECKSKLETLKLDEKKIKDEIFGREEEKRRIFEELAKGGEEFQKLKKNSERLQEKQKSFYETQSKLESIKNYLENLEEKKSEVDEKTERLKTELDRKKEERIKTQKKRDNLVLNLEKIRNELSDVEKKRGELEEELTSFEREIQEKNRERIELVSRQKAILEFKRFKDLKRKAFEEVLKIKGVFGRISELSKVSEKYAKALEIALRGRLENIVVDTDETARRCVFLLKKKRLSRLTFLPLNTLKAYVRRDENFLKREGALDFAINLVRFDSKFRVAFEYVLGDTLVVKDLDSTKDIGVRVVTIDGDLVEKSGAITGGFYHKPSLPEENEKRISELKIKISDLENLKRECKRELLKLLKNQKDLENERIRFEVLIPTFDEKSLEMKKEILDIEKELSKLFKQKKRIQNDSDSMKEIYSQNLQKKNNLESEIETLKGESEKLKLSGMLELEDVEAQLEKLNSNLGEVRVKVARENSKLSYHEQNISRLDETKAELKKEFRSLEREKSEKALKLSLLQRELALEREKEEEFYQSLKGKRELRRRKMIELENLRKRKENFQKNIYILASSVELLRQKYDQLKSQISELEEKAVEILKDEDYDDLSELRFKIQKMKAEKERLEPINMRAVEEYSKVEMRYLSLKSRIDKLLEERDSILRFIEEVESQKKKVFMKTFERVTLNFQEIFSELSPGGSARLIIENPEDPFEGGLDVEASPAGKEIKKVDAMSGGEKALTALAFLFAIHRFKPAPFYVFDEIDAHLDDPNCKRVARMIERASEDTQFIVITLRDIMMASAELLYGVTMKDGISKILSVRLEEISEYTEPTYVIG
ncbi:MAG: chromosome segregation protein SMC [Candidatus Methanofastidiosia archaeon]